MPTGKLPAPRPQATRPRAHKKPYLSRAPCVRGSGGVVSRPPLLGSLSRPVRCAGPTVLWVVGRTQGLSFPSVKWGKGTCRLPPNFIHSSTLRKWTVSAARWVWWKHQPSGFLLSPDFHLDPLSRRAERLATLGYWHSRWMGLVCCGFEGQPSGLRLGRLSACPSYVCLGPSLNLRVGPGSAGARRGALGGPGRASLAGGPLPRAVPCHSRPGVVAVPGGSRVAGAGS